MSAPHLVTNYLHKKSKNQTQEREERREKIEESNFPGAKCEVSFFFQCSIALFFDPFKIRENYAVRKTKLNSLQQSTIKCT